MTRTAVPTSSRMSRTDRMRPGLYVSSTGEGKAAVITGPPTGKLGATKLVSKREELFGELQPLVRRLIQRFGEDPEMRRDLEGEIYYRFCMLLDAYDPARGVPLRPYLIRQLSASVYTYARQGWRR